MPVPLILSAGASITVGGLEIPLPYVGCTTLFGGMFRYPERFAPVLLIPAVIFIMQTLTPLSGRIALAARDPGASLLLTVMLDCADVQPVPDPAHPHAVPFLRGDGPGAV